VAPARAAVRHLPRAPRAVVGSNVPRREGLEKLTGRALYVADLDVPGAWWGVTVRSPHARARILSIERDLGADGARAVVVTAEDLLRSGRDNVVHLALTDPAAWQQTYPGCPLSSGDINDNGNSLVFSYQYLPGGLLRFEGDLEYYSDGYGGSTSTAWAPQAYVLLGRGFYGGVGIGATKSDFPNGDSWSDPWYAAKIGLDLLLLPKIHLDINANYRADAFNELDNAKSDAVTLGASVRLAF